jgi:hypothetical protein
MSKPVQRLDGIWMIKKETKRILNPKIIIIKFNINQNPKICLIIIFITFNNLSNKFKRIISYGNLGEPKKIRFRQFFTRSLLICFNWTWIFLSSILWGFNFPLINHFGFSGTLQFHYLVTKIPENVWISNFDFMKHSPNTN